MWIFYGAVLVALTATYAPACAGQTINAPLEIAYGPTENLERLDGDLIRRASRSIDMAAYTLTSYAEINALREAAERGVAVRLYLDPGQLQQARIMDRAPFIQLARTSGVEIRLKSPSAPLMHLKDFAIDGAIFRSGSANMSVDGLKRQDNSLIVVHSPDAARVFLREFEAIWTRPDNQRFN